MKYTLSDAEQEIMESLWSGGKWLTAMEILELCNERTGKDWKRQTVNTFLTRLIAKGFVTKRGHKFIYTYTSDEVKCQEAVDMLDSQFDGSLYNFISAISGTKKINSDDAEQLKKMLEDLESKQ